MFFNRMISSYLSMLTSNFPLTLLKALVFFWIFKHGISLGKISHDTAEKEKPHRTIL